EIEAEKKKKLKQHVAVQAKSQEKKRETLENKGELIRYDSPGRPSFLLLNPDLPEQMHSCIEF
ncbi:28750_t:CDS:1, partial [Racocetra persica]